MKTAKDPDGGPYPVYPSGKSRDEFSYKMGSRKKFFYNAISEADFPLYRDEWQVHGGQLQLHRNKGDLQGSESQRRTRSGEVSRDTETCPSSASEL